MFRVQRSQTKPYRLPMIGLLLLSLAALAVTVWIMADFLREQEIVQRLMQQLPPSAEAEAEELAGELRWQFRLAILVLLNLVVTGCAVVLLWRAYSTSLQSLHDVKVLAGDILSSTDQAVITTDITGNVTSINRRGFEILGLDESIIGHPLVDARSQIPLEEFRQQAAEHRPTRWARDFQIQQGDQVTTIRGFCEPLRDEIQNEVGTLFQLRDDTDRVLIEQQVKRMERFLGLGSLAIGLHHEIKNPLAALSLHVQLLEEHLEQQELDDESHELLSVLKTEVTRITGVLESFRSYAAFDELVIASVDLAALLKRQVNLISPQARGANIDVALKLPGHIPAIQADENKLEQVVLNLLINAMEAQPNGGVINVCVTMNEDSVSIEVADAGSGIPDKVADRIFDPYFTTKSTGTGLGLAICEKIVRQHFGSLNLLPCDRGALFVLTLPTEQP